MFPKAIRHSSFLANSACRSPGWRIQRVLDLLKNGSAPKRQIDDEITADLFKFKKAWDAAAKRSRSEFEVRERRFSLFHGNPGLYYASELFFQEDCDKERYTIEARILARQNDSVIAEGLGTQAETIGWYERCFFNVRDRLDRRDYIVNRVISPAVLSKSTGWAAITPNMTAKFFGYFGGPPVLDTILFAFNESVVPPTSKEGVEEFLRSHFSAQMTRRAATIVNDFEINKYTVLGFLEANAKLLEISQKAKADNGDLGAMEQSIALVLGGLPILTGDRSKAALEKSPVKGYYGNPAELRADELLRLQNGEVPDTVLELANLPPAPLYRDKSDAPAVPTN